MEVGAIALSEAVAGSGDRGTDGAGPAAGDESVDRLATLVSVMGGVLLTAGVLAVFVDVRFEPLGPFPVARSLILLGVATAFVLTGLALRGRGTPRAGYGLAVAGTLLLGPPLFVLQSALVPVDVGWTPFLAWGALATWVGYVARSRLITIVGLLVGTIGVTSALSLGSHDDAFALALVGTLYVGVAPAVGGRSERLVADYRWIGLFLVATFLLRVVALSSGSSPVTFSPSLAVVVVAAVVAGVLLALLGGVTVGRLDLGTEDLLAVLATGTASIAGYGVLIGSAALPAVVTLVVAHATLLAFVASSAVVGIRSQSLAVVDVAALAFFLYVLILLALGADAGLSGSLVLLAGGGALIVTALGLERGRRRALART